MLGHGGVKYDLVYLLTSGPSPWGADQHPLARKLKVYKKTLF